MGWIDGQFYYKNAGVEKVGLNNKHVDLKVPKKKRLRCVLHTCYRHTLVNEYNIFEIKEKLNWSGIFTNKLQSQ